MVEDSLFPIKAYEVNYHNQQNSIDRKVKVYNNYNNKI